MVQKSLLCALRALEEVHIEGLDGSQGGDDDGDGDAYVDVRGGDTCKHHACVHMENWLAKPMDNARILV